MTSAKFTAVLAMVALVASGCAATESNPQATTKTVVIKASPESVGVLAIDHWMVELPAAPTPSSGHITAVGMTADGQRLFDVRVDVIDAEDGIVEISRDGEVAESASDDSLALLAHLQVDVAAAKVDLQAEMAAAKADLQYDETNACYWESMALGLAELALISATLAVTPACAALPFSVAACAAALTAYAAAAGAVALAAAALTSCMAQHPPNPPPVGG